MSLAQNRLVLMADAPQKGKVFKKLARKIGEDEALEAYKASVKSICSRVSGDSRWSFSIAVWPDREAHNPLFMGYRSFGQGKGSRGARIMNLMINLAPGPTILITPDCPFFTPDDLAKGFSALATNDILFGPDNRGGFWCVGMKREPVPLDPFKKVDWKGDAVLKTALAALKPTRKREMLRELNNLDTPEALEEFKALEG